MKLALIGYGAMGRLVEAEARKAGLEIGSIVNSNDTGLGAKQLSEKLRDHDVAVDFSVAAAVLRNIEACSLAGVPLVEGTTGWDSEWLEVKRIVSQHDTALVYGSNFSLGVNVFYRIVEQASKLFAAVDGYAPFIEEAHHARKRDAPSGTALRIRERMSAYFGSNIPTSSTRAGHIPGTHRVGFDSVADQILLVHEARSRHGFAAGALVAANWIVGRKGVYEFTEVVGKILEGSNS